MRRFNFVVVVLLAVLVLGSGSGVWAQQFAKSEYAGRRAKLMEKIPDGVAIIRGAQVPGAYYAYYQNNDFMYLSGFEIPNSILVVDGVKKESVLFFTATVKNARNEGI
ncbi:MAG: hypothetical protein GY869_18490, partial [Planctomycetes bacterium]|nr:hypothetical protein [Planctomycetota bacterium]